MKNPYLLPMVLFASFLNAGCNSTRAVPAIEATSTLMSYSVRPSPTDTSKRLIAATFAPSGPTATPFAHIVQQGETLLGIAIRYGVTLDDLLIVNPGIDPRILSVGESVLIPGPGGEPIKLLLATPTPVALQIDQVRCFPASGETVRCLTTITNSQTGPLEGIVVQISLLDSVGDLLAQSDAYSLARWLPEDQSMVLEATFNVDLKSIAFVQAEILSAVQVSNLDERLVRVEVTELNLDRLVESRLFRFKGQIELIEGGQDGPVLLTLQAFGYNANGEAVGSNGLQVQIQPEGFPHPFELPLFSLSGPIDDFGLLVEAQRVLSDG